jgi:predicted MFS family arabinose efflux permease
MVSGIAWAIGPVANGWVYDNTSPVSVWYLTLALAMVGTVAFILVGRLPALSREAKPAPLGPDEEML